MPTLVATAGDASANTYCTTDEADTYMDTVLHAEDWTNADTTTKQKALISATRLLDERFDWIGAPNSLGQALQWPRFGIYDRLGNLLDADEIPTFLKEATAELARFLIPTDRTADPEGQGFLSVSLPGGTSFTRNPYEKAPVIPQSVVSKLQFWIQGQRLNGQVKVLRT